MVPLSTFFDDVKSFFLSPPACRGRHCQTGGAGGAAAALAARDVPAGTAHGFPSQHQTVRSAPNHGYKLPSIMRLPWFTGKFTSYPASIPWQAGISTRR
jgi:hypothetical protein